MQKVNSSDHLFVSEKEMVYSVQNFYEQCGKSLELELVAGAKGLKRRIQKSEVHRPGLGLAGFLKKYSSSRILIFGKHEIDYLKDLDPDLRRERLSLIFSPATPALVIARNLRPPKEVVELCEERDLPLFRSGFRATSLIPHITFFLMEKFSPRAIIPGTLVELYGVGVLIQGELSIGKSEAALGLIERGHRLVSDEIVHVNRKENRLVGAGDELTRHLIEIRGIGVINVAHLYGAICVRPDKEIDIVVKLEKWNDQYFYDRIGLDEKFIEMLGTSLSYHVLPVKPGRDVVLLLETIALSHRLKDMGYHSAKEFNVKLLEAIARKKK
jgi:HPr kinase/phosphorylase